MNISEEMEIAVAGFEAEFGQIPSVESVEAMYGVYTAKWAKRGKTVGGIGNFIQSLARRGYMPVRLPDGSIGLLGIALKSSKALPEGSIQ